MMAAAQNVIGKVFFLANLSTVWDDLESELIPVNVDSVWRYGNIICYTLIEKHGYKGWKVVYVLNRKDYYWCE